MKLFQCQSCAQLVYFENTICEKCGHQLGFIPELTNMTSIEPKEAGIFEPIAASSGARYRYCANANFGACNWLVAAESCDSFCRACRHNRLVPDVSIPANLRSWQQTEFAKHRLFYSLIMLRLPLENRQDAPEYGLTFEFPASQGLDSKILTGHDNGVITIALEEADDVERETRRTAMHEPYRTLLGHFRHEIGHYYWDRLVRDGNKLDAARAVFGDDRVDYNEALKAHYANGAAPDWQHNFVTPYATAHPWEDFAETWAHYLHIVDTVEMAGAFGLQIRPPLDTIGDMRAVVDFDPYNARHMNHIVEIWLPLSTALNSLNRTMGQADVYPFVLSEGVIRKLGFIHNLIMANQSSSREIQLTPKQA